MYPGEVVGIADVGGSGQVRLTEVLVGARKALGSTARINGEEVPIRNTKDFIDKDTAYIPADRNYVDSVPGFPLCENWASRNKRPSRRGWSLDYRFIKTRAAKATVDLDVRARGVIDRSANLPGGNLQKLVPARMLSKHPKAMVRAYPTRELDIKAIWFIREKILKAREDGVRLLPLSEDLEGLFVLSDHAVVLYWGRIAGKMVPEKATVRGVGIMMIGVTADETI